MQNSLMLKFLSKNVIRSRVSYKSKYGSTYVICMYTYSDHYTHIISVYIHVNPLHKRYNGNKDTALPDICNHPVFTCLPTQVNVPRLNPSQTSWYSIYLPWRERRLSDLTRPRTNWGRCRVTDVNNMSFLWPNVSMI